MKTIILTLVATCFFGCTMAQQQTLTVQITNIKNDEGQIAVALYNSEKDFMKTRYQGKTTKSVKGEVEIVFNNIPSGSYSLSVMHDANVNEKLDSNFFGIPKEGFGFSNNAMGTFGPPSFEKAKVEVSTPKTISIALRYM
jgi:uncharacterized protein (DUF2141 family)